MRYNGRTAGREEMGSAASAASAVEPLEERMLMSGVPVLIVPGILGSLPKGDSVRLWLLNDPAGTAPEAMEAEYLTDSYDPIIDAFEQQAYEPGVHYRLGTNLFVATYDWRRPVGLHGVNADGYPVTDAGADGLPDTAAGEIDCGVEYLEYWIAKAKAMTGSDKVDIVAHSMGGLVAREYIQSDYYAGDVDKLVMLGTPNHGSAAAVEMWEFGTSDDATQDYFSDVFDQAKKAYDADWRNVAGLPEGLDGFDEFVRAYVPGLRDLLPTYDYEYLDGGPVIPNDPPVNPWLVALNAPEGLAKYAARGVDVTIVGARGEDTPATVVLEHDGDGVDHYHEADGDGDVLFDYHNGTIGPASVFLEGLDNNAADRLECEHVELTSDPDAVDTTMRALGLPTLDGDYDQGTAGWLSTWWRAMGWGNSKSLLSRARDGLSSHPQTLYFHAGSSVSFTDADGDRVTVKLTGPGEGQVDFALAVKVGHHLDADAIGLSGTTAASRLSISVDRHATGIATITVDGSLAALNAGGVGLGEALDVSGSLGSLSLGDCLNAPTITIAASAGPATLSFGRVADVSIDSPAPLASLSAARWLDTDAAPDTITAPWIDKVTIRGDFDASLILTGAGAPADKLLLGSATVSGRADGALWDIPGSTGAISLGALDTVIDIDGACRSFKVSGYLALLAPASGATGSFHAAGPAAVTGAGGFRATVTGQTLYASSASPYALEDLRLFNTPAAAWTYDANYGTAARPLPAVATVTVAAAPQSIGGLDYLPVTTATAAYASTSLWRADVLGSHLGAFSASAPAGDFDAVFTVPLATPALLQLGRRYSWASAFTGTASFAIGLDAVSGPLVGSATLVSQFLGHDTVATPAGAWLAAKTSTDLSLAGTIAITYAGKPLTVRFTARERSTAWSVPGVGVVKSAQSVTLTLIIPGHPRQSLALAGTLLLNAYHL